MRNGLLHRCFVLALGSSFCLGLVTDSLRAGETESLIEALLGDVSKQADDSFDDQLDFGSRIHFRALPKQTHRPSVRRAPRPPAAPGIRILDPFGRIQKLVLLLRFKGHADRQLPNKEAYEAVFNGESEHPEFATSGSARAYSKEVSYGKMDITTTIVDWIDLPETEQYYANGVEGDPERIAEGIKYALDYADEKGLVDFNEFDRNGDRYVDLFSIVHSGYGAEFAGEDIDGVGLRDRIWSHQWRIPVWTSSRSGTRVSEYSCSTGLRGIKGSAPCRIGLLAHEVAHLGGLPDLYDGHGGQGIGAWGLLGYSEGFKNTGHTPTHFSPWAKYRLGWLKPKDLTEPGEYRIKNVENYPDVYRIKDGFPDGEYLLIENRQPVGFDRELPGGKGGLAIWHIDANKKHNREPGHPGVSGWPENGAHYMVALVQADGQFDLERGRNLGDAGDLFRGGTNGVNRVSAHEPHGLRPYRLDPNVERVLHRISEISEPGQEMTFRYDVEPPSAIAQPRENPNIVDAGTMEPGSNEHDNHGVEHEHEEHLHIRVLPGQTDIPQIDLPPMPAEPGKRRVSPFGRIRKLILLLRFKGHEDRELPGPDVYDIIFNRPGGHRDYAEDGSAFDYSREISYEQMEISSHIVGWIDLPETEQYYSGGVSGIKRGNRIAEAITYALDFVDENNLVDFRDFDKSRDGFVDVFGVIHSGYGAEYPSPDAAGVDRQNRIWSHQWRIPTWTSQRSGLRITDYAMSAGLQNVRGSLPTRIGLFAHETAHLAGLPDLYGKGHSGHGIGAWGLMGAHQGFEMDGHAPSHPCPWTKIKVGWVKPTDLTRSGDYKIGHIEEHPTVYRIQEGFPKGEYLLIENRHAYGFHHELPGRVGGLAIWHIDDKKPDNSQPGYPGMAGWPENNSHYKVALIQADGRFDLEHGRNLGDQYDLFRRGGVDQISSDDQNGLRPYVIDPRVERVFHRISMISEPGEVMSFRYETSARSGPDGADDQSLSTTSSETELTAPIRGATIVTAEFSHEDRRRVSTDGIVLEARIELTNECIVHVRGDASVVSDVGAGVFSTGVSNGEPSAQSMWKDSFRLVAVAGANRFASFGVNCRRRLPPGQHTIRWIVESKQALRLPAGGTLVVQAYPCVPRTSGGK